jgi:acetyl-CoA carboxylase biotin carboxyl carrier protein
MEVRDLKTLLALMQEYGLVELEVEDKKGKVRLVRGNLDHAGGGPVPEPARIAARTPVATAPKKTPAATVGAQGGGRRNEAPELEANQRLVASPMVGTFYRAAAPNAPPFVEEGDTVRKGQPLCIIEAMKMMNEIEAEVGGRVVKIVCENGQPIEYGQALMILEVG